LAAITKLGFDVQQVYGLTETYGHVTECLWDPAWDALPQDEAASIAARQGVAFPMMEPVAVWDDSGNDIPRDGTTTGEIMLRGNCVMKGLSEKSGRHRRGLCGRVFPQRRHCPAPPRRVHSNR
jgi:fatty-acyl-CoA synthase